MQQMALLILTELIYVKFQKERYSFIEEELELYFKAVDELKSKLENYQRTLSTLNTVIEKGLKEDMGCIAFRGAEGLLEISFLKSAGTRENFTLKSIYTGKAIPVENTIKIGV